MIVNEEDFDALVEAVENAQVRLADTYMVRVLAQLLDTVEEMQAKVDQMYEFLSSEDEEAEVAPADVETKVEKQEEVKPVSKTKKTEEATKPVETKVETES